MQTIKDFWNTATAFGKFAVSILIVASILIIASMIAFEGARIVFGVFIGSFLIMFGITGTISAVHTFKRNKRYEP